MDNGLDIDTQRTLLAVHAAAYADTRVLSPLLNSERPVHEALAAVQRTLRARGAMPRWDAADSALSWLDAPGHAVVCYRDPDYPAVLRTIAQPPLILFVDGCVPALSSPQIAIVGSRKATAAGNDIAREVACALASRGITVTSGLAYGIDAAAHRGAIAANGSTLALFGCAIDRIYPRRHRELADAIRSHGALVAEFPFGTPPLPAHFPQRNRLISGLSLGTVVVEAALRSGSISTALHANEQGREVFAVPGSIRNPMSAGCHALIRQGARLFESVNDIFDELPVLATFVGPESLGNVASRQYLDEGVAELPLAARVLAACGWDACTLDELVVRSGLTVPEVSSMLLRLELAGVIQAQTSGSYLRIR